MKIKRLGEQGTDRKIAGLTSSRGEDNFGRENKGW